MSKTALKPPFRSSMTVPQLLDFHYKYNAAQPAFVFADAEDTLTEITYLEYIRACHRVAHFVRPERTGPGRAVVAVVALADNLVYQTINVGIIYAGLVPLLISPRLTPAAVVNLLKVSGAHRLLTTGATLHELIRGIKEKLTSTDPAYELSIEEVPIISQLFPKLGNEKVADEFEAFSLWKSIYPTPQETALYLHSSGSTGFPKCIPLSHWMLDCAFSNVLGAYYRYPTQLRVTGMMLPPFHIMGLCIQLICPLYASISVGLFPPTVTRPDALPVTATPESILTHSRRTHSNAMIAVPSLLEALSQTAAGVEFLRSFETVSFGGGPLAPATGNYLVSCGVHLRAVYGATEIGFPVILDIEGKAGFEDWGWFNLRDIPYVRWVSQGDGTSELQLLTTETFKPAIENLDDVLGYATSDLFSPHPTKPGFWKIIGRVDDVITHSSGEKTVPLPMEQDAGGAPSEDYRIQGAIMFGRQRDQPGFLIEPTPEYQVDVTDEAQVSQFRNKIWSVIEEANQIAPTFSKVYKEMILVASAGKPLPRAAKGTISRKAAYEEYKNEIDQIYDIVESNGGGSTTPPRSWEIQDVQEWISVQVVELCGNKVDVSDDLFQHGIDSLSATILRLRVSTILDSRSSEGAVQHISQAALYSHPSIKSLARYIIDLIDLKHPGQNLNASHQVLMEQMIETYSEGLGSIPTSNSEGHSGPAVVLLTGSTGNLGAQMLVSLIGDNRVAKVYTFNRPSTYSIIARHKERFEDKALDAGLLFSDKLVFLEGELSKPNLGLSPNQYNELLESITVIIHNAWRLDFNLSLSSFSTHISGTRNLVDLARSSRYASSLRFLFTSSISAAQPWNSVLKGSYPGNNGSNPELLVGGGYGESKYVAERILGNSGLRVSVLRIGQISGGKPNGAWAVVSWCPMDAISEAILDVAFIKKDPPLVVNLVHPFPTSWTSVINSIRKVMISAKGLDSNALPLVSLEEWTAALEAVHATSKERMEELPALKILGFIQLLSHGDKTVEMSGDLLMEMGGIGSFSMEHALQISPRMRNLEPICLADVQMWVKYWIRNGM